MSTELLKLELLELQNKFIIDNNSMIPFGNSYPPPRFNNTKVIDRFVAKDTIVIQGRILPQREPYCYASFLIEIKLLPGYPFQAPELIFLDPIYHPNVDEFGRHCCCWGYSCDEKWTPTTPLIALILTVLHVIDNGPDPGHCIGTGSQLMVEYQSNYLKFYKKALEHTLLYGRPRY
jgi:ubiquitin-conjugating enzyme E2 T